MRYPLRAAVCLLPLVVLAAVVAFVFRYHLTWQIFLKPDYVVEGAYEAPIARMPTAKVPDDWVEDQADVLTLYLPQDAVNSKSLTTDSIPAIAYQVGGMVVIVVPADKSDAQHDPDLRQAERLFPGDRQFTWPSLRLEIYKANVDDFSWTMSNERLFWYQFCMANRIERPGEKVESYFGDDIEGILVFTDETRANFDWQSRQKPFKGLILFSSDEGPLDAPLIRTICQGIRLEKQ